MQHPRYTLFFNEFPKFNHSYPTSSKSSSNYAIPKATMRLTNFLTNYQPFSILPFKIPFLTFLVGISYYS